MLSYPGLPGDAILAAVRRARKKLIWKVLLNPPQLLQYLRMIYDLSGFKGLWSTAVEKTGYLMSGS